MFDRDVDYPRAVAIYDDEGVDAAIDGCCQHMKDGDTLTVWASLKSNLRNCSQLERLVNRHSNVEHVTGRGGGFIRGKGPVLMARADVNDIGQLVQYGGHGIRALFVITWNEEAITPPPGRQTVMPIRGRPSQRHRIRRPARRLASDHGGRRSPEPS